MTERNPRPRPHGVIPTSNDRESSELTVRPARASNPLPHTPHDLEQQQESDFRSQQEDLLEELTKYSPYAG
jgi:hypothetical protein